jgi:glutamine phosphoribosylpyrophosphate amidotransferase
VAAVTLIDLVDYPDIPYGTLSKGEIVDQGLSGAALPSAQYAFAFARDNLIYLARDPLGCNELFFGTHPNGSLVVANRITRLWQSGVPLAAVGSCPPGHFVAKLRQVDVLVSQGQNMVDAKQFR